MSGALFDHNDIQQRVEGDLGDPVVVLPIAPLPIINKIRAASP